MHSSQSKKNNQLSDLLKPGKKSGHRRAKTSMNITVSTLKNKPCRMSEYLTEQQIIQELEEEIVMPTLVQKMSENSVCLSSKTQKSFLSFLKGKFIVQEILDQIEMDNLINLSVEENVQFMFLICSRAKNYLKEASIIFNEAKVMSFSKIQGRLSEEEEGVQEFSHYSEQCQLFLQKVQGKWLSYDHMIDEIQRKILKQLSHMLWFLRKKERIKFLDGIEGLDFSIAEQIGFTYKNYTQSILNSPQINSETFKNHRLKRILRAYQKICQVRSISGFFMSGISQNQEVEADRKMKLSELQHNFAQKVNTIISDE